MENKYFQELSEHIEFVKARQRVEAARRREQELRQYGDLALCVAIFILVVTVALAVWWM